MSIKDSENVTFNRGTSLTCIAPSEEEETSLFSRSSKVSDESEL